MKLITSKKGAIELSVGTIVIIVLAMSMLILGLVLVRNIFTGAIHNVDTIDDKVKGELNKLFTDEGQKIAIFLPDNVAKIKKGETFGVAFAIKDTIRGDSGSASFRYEITATSVETSCSLTEVQADQYLILRSSGSFDLAPGNTHFDRVRIRPSDNAPLCEISYDVAIWRDGSPYKTSFFVVQITS